MDPAEAFNFLLDEIKRSNLNFHVFETPFTASIQIKKSFIKDRDGTVRTCGVIPYRSDEEKVLVAKDDLLRKNESLQTELVNTQNHYEGLKVEIQQFQISERIFEKKKVDLEEQLEVKMSEIALLKKTVKNQEGHKNEMKKDADQLNKNLRSKEKELVKLNIKTENMSSNIQALKSEVSKLKKENNKLEKSVKKGNNVNNKQLLSLTPSSSPLNRSLETENNNLSKPCKPSSSTLPFISLSKLPPSRPSISLPSTSIATLTSSPLPPTSSSSPSSTLTTNPPSPSKTSSSSATSCPHSPQCVVGQPKQPTTEKCNILVHRGSKYHEHMASEEGVPARYCMRIEYENYGCADCKTAINAF